MSWARSSVRGASALLVALLAGVFVAPSAAQPGSQPFFQIRAEPDQQTKTITQDLGSVEFRIKASVNPQQSSSLNSQFQIKVNVTVNKTGVPNGWSLSDADLDGDSREKTVRAGQEFNITLTAFLSHSQPSADSVNIEVVIVSKPEFQGSTDPVTTQLANSQSAKDQETVKLTANRLLEPAEALTSFVKTNRWYLLAAAGGLFVLGVVLVRKKRGMVVANSDSPVQEVLPGRGASFPVNLTNEGGTKEQVTITTSEVPEGWSAILPVEKINLHENESTTVWMTLKAPADAQPGEHIQVSLIATTDAGHSAETLLEAVVVEKYGRAPGRPGPPEGAAEEPMEAPVRPSRPSPARRAKPR